MTMGSYIVSPDGGFITCLRCGKTSYNLDDVAKRYCGNCHLFHDDVTPAQVSQQQIGAGRVHIVQCLCPQRHCIMGLAYEDGAATEPEATAMLRGTMEQLQIHPWCGICGMGNFRFEDRLTPFVTMQDAAPFLTLCQVSNLVAMAHYARMPKNN